MHLLPGLLALQQPDHKQANIRRMQLQTTDAAVHACVLASVVTKRASAMAFERHGRSVTAPDILDCVGKAFKDFSPYGF